MEEFLSIRSFLLSLKCCDLFLCENRLDFVKDQLNNYSLLTAVPSQMEEDMNFILYKRSFLLSLNYTYCIWENRLHCVIDELNNYIKHTRKSLIQACTLQVEDLFGIYLFEKLLGNSIRLSKLVLLLEFDEKISHLGRYNLTFTINSFCL